MQNFIMVGIFQVSAFVENTAKTAVSAAGMTGWYAKSEGGRYYGRKQTENDRKRAGSAC